jgi:ribosomal protein L7/L12
MDNAIPDEKTMAIKEAVFRGEKIAAIKLYREATGLGLVEAKEAVERLEAELRSSSPFEFKKEESRGCLGIVLIFIVLAAGIIYLARR